MMTQYQAALIGCGKVPSDDVTVGKIDGGFRIGYCHGDMYKLHPQTILTAAADIDTTNLEAFQKQFDVPHGFTDYNEMLREVKPDIVSICTYVGLHRRMMEDCANAGVKAVFCEKPFIGSPKDLADIHKIADETGMKIAISHQRSTHPGMKRVAELYNDGTIGERLAYMYSVEDWDLSEMASHWLDLGRLVHNDDPVEWVMCQSRVTDTRGFGHAMEDHALATFAFKNGGRVIIDAGKHFVGPWSEMVVGTKGMIGIVNESQMHIYSEEGFRIEDHSRDDDWNLLWQDSMDGIIGWIENGVVPVIGLPRTGVTAELAFAAYWSALKGDRIDMPLDDEFWACDEWPVELIARKNASS